MSVYKYGQWSIPVGVLSLFIGGLIFGIAYAGAIEDREMAEAELDRLKAEQQDNWDNGTPDPYAESRIESQEYSLDYAKDEETYSLIRLIATLGSGAFTLLVGILALILRRVELKEEQRRALTEVSTEDWFADDGGNEFGGSQSAPDNSGYGGQDQYGRNGNL